MIYDRLSNLRLYKGIHPNLDLALDYIAANLDTMPDHVDILGTEVYANINVYTTKDEAEAFFESHALYADIQIMRKGAERMAVSHISNLEITDTKPEKDFWAHSGPEEGSFIMEPGSFIIFFPGDAHKLGMHLGQPETVEKSVFKVRMN